MMGQKGAQKGGYRGNQMWSAHRMEGGVKNAGSKPKMKQKKGSK